MLTKLITVTLLATALSSAAWIKDCDVPAQTGKDDSFIVGIFRPDGVIVPFARYANRKWTNPWHSPQPGEQTDEPDTIADLPKPWYESFVKPSGDWYLSLSSGDMRTVRTSKTLQVCSHCQQVWGLLSDYPNPKQPEKNECVQNLGVAISEDRRAWPMNRLTSALPQWKQFLALVGPAFEKAENGALAEELNRQYARQLPPAQERAKKPLSMLSLHQGQLPEGRVLFHFEASKEYRNFYISLFGGWVLQDAHGKLTLLDSQFTPTDLDMKEGDMTEPFIILSLDGKTFAIVEEDAYEGEGYTVLEIMKDKVRRVLETLAGSC